MWTIEPRSSSIARWQKRFSEAMSWVTNTIVLPSSRMRLKDVEALLLERGVADGEDLVDQQDVGVDLDRDRERQADVHPRGVVLELQVLELAQLGEVDHAVVALASLARGEAHHDPVHDHVVARREIGVEADAELDERRQPPAAPDVTLGAVDPGQALEQRALAAAVAPGDAEELALAGPQKEMSSSARKLWCAMRRRGCSARSLSVCTRCSGIRKVLPTPRATIVGRGLCEAEAMVRGYLRATGAGPARWKALGVPPEHRAGGARGVVDGRPAEQRQRRRPPRPCTGPAPVGARQPPHLERVAADARRTRDPVDVPERARLVEAPAQPAPVRVLVRVHDAGIRHVHLGVAGAQHVVGQHVILGIGHGPERHPLPRGAGDAAVGVGEEPART